MKKVYRSLSNWEIDDYYQGNPMYKGCFPKNALPNKIESGFYIINLENANQDGSHWTLIIYLPNMPVVLYFDPFGVVPPMEALSFMRTARKDMYYSTLDLQNIESSLCGYYCIYVADQMMSGRKFLDICAKDFRNSTEINDKKIKAYFRNTNF